MDVVQRYDMERAKAARDEREVVRKQIEYWFEYTPPVAETITVAQLIEKLRAFPQGARVMLSDYEILTECSFVEGDQEVPDTVILA